MNLLWYLHWFIPIRISHLKYYSISVEQARYNTAVVSKYIDTSTIEENPKYQKTTLPHDMMFTEEYSSSSDEQV